MNRCFLILQKEWSILKRKIVYSDKVSFFILDRYSSNFTVDLLPGDSYVSFKVFLLAVPSDSRERRGLAQVSLFKTAVARDFSCQLRVVYNGL
jgi:hypothetical protein